MAFSASTRPPTPSTGPQYRVPPPIIGPGPPAPSSTQYRVPPPIFGPPASPYGETEEHLSPAEKFIWLLGDWATTSDEIQRCITNSYSGNNVSSDDGLELQSILNHAVQRLCARHGSLSMFRPGAFDVNLLRIEASGKAQVLLDRHDREHVTLIARIDNKIKEVTAQRWQLRQEQNTMPTYPSRPSDPGNLVEVPRGRFESHPSPN